MAERRAGYWWKRLLLMAVLAALIAALFLLFGEQLRFDRLADREHQLREWQQTHPWVSYLAAFLVYVVVTGVSLPGAGIMTVVYGWLFGPIAGVIIVSFASTTGASVAFLLSRYLFRDTFQGWFGGKLEAVNRALDEEGAYYLFTMRLIPLIPFFVINAVMGLTRIRLVTFWWVSQLGMLPFTIVYVYAGSTLPTLSQIADRDKPILSLQLVIAFVAMGLFPLMTRRVVQWSRKRRKD